MQGESCTSLLELCALRESIQLELQNVTQRVLEVSRGDNVDLLLSCLTERDATFIKFTDLQNVIDSIGNLQSIAENLPEIKRKELTCILVRTAEITQTVQQLDQEIIANLNKHKQHIAQELQQNLIKKSMTKSYAKPLYEAKYVDKKGT